VKLTGCDAGTGSSGAVSAHVTPPSNKKSPKIRKTICILSMPLPNRGTFDTDEYATPFDGFPTLTSGPALPGMAIKDHRCF
jgi:hypothetical protein